ncbi:MAG: sugar phosphate isomerase/epimerase [Armatimonadota bacterium]|jgi:sugar phosphate isomerase/epimerase
MEASISRRQFLAASAAGAASFGLGPARGDTRPASLTKYGGFRFGIQAHGLRNFPIDEAIRIIHDELELHWVEFSRKHLEVEAPPDEIRRVLALLEQNDITCNALGVHRFTADHEANRRVFEFAKAMGVRNISANPSADAFDSLEKLVADYGILIAIHNHGPGAPYDKVADVVNAVKDRHANIGACIDTGHFIRSAEDPVQAIHTLKGRVFGLHIKDVAEQTQKTHDVIIGEGFLDVEGMFKALKDVSFPAGGALSLEFEGNPDDPVAEIKQCLAVAARAAQRVAAS